MNNNDKSDSEREFLNHIFDIPTPTQIIPIPSPSPTLVCFSYPFPWESRGNPVGIPWESHGNPIPTRNLIHKHTSSSLYVHFAD